MWQALNQSDSRSRLNFVVMALFLALAFLFGGASRADVVSQPVIRLAALGLIVFVMLQARMEEVRSVRGPLIFLIAIMLAIAIQLVPLPPAIWAALPGREIYSNAMETAGLASVWRPLSLTPDLTLNSLLALLPVFAVVLGVAVIDRSLHVYLVPIILVGIALSAIIGVLQIGSGSLYFYRITNLGSAVGVFANRNHQALLLAAAFPLLVAWTVLPYADPQYRRVRMWLALCLSAAVFPFLLITGSRAGVALGFIGAVGSGLLLVAAYRRGRQVRSARSRLVALLFWIAPLAVGLLAVGATVIFSRDEAIQRFSDATVETRTEQLPIFGEMIRSFAPWGSGYGSFDPAFRAFEPHASLRPTYLNHAHNDLAQILIEGGVLAGVLLAVFLLWYSARIWRLWVRPARHHPDLVGRAASIVVLLILLSSLVDYPLRTPLLLVILGVSCILMLDSSIARAEKEGLGRVGAVG